VYVIGPASAGGTTVGTMGAVAITGRAMRAAAAGLAGESAVGAWAEAVKVRAKARARKPDKARMKISLRGREALFRLGNRSTGGKTWARVVELQCGCYFVAAQAQAVKLWAESWFIEHAY
jgi:hypothetical protein